ncbi:hypothetical protein ACEQPO_20785 [Bacillus sp. SL00103]
MDGSCQVPIAGYATMNERDEIELTVLWHLLMDIRLFEKLYQALTLRQLEQHAKQMAG